LNFDFFTRQLSLFFSYGGFWKRGHKTEHEIIRKRLHKFEKREREW
jgi:hypothetical protein